VDSLTFKKVFASVKMWPIGWAVLTTFNERRGTLEAFDGPERGGGSAFLGIASMCLLIPAITYGVVHLATAAAAAAIPFAQGVPPAAGAGLGPAGPVVNVAARLGR
jgi:hypothetical protein